jgi:hypothetical protein
VLAKITPDLAIGWMGNSGYISVVYWHPVELLYVTIW